MGGISCLMIPPEALERMYKAFYEISPDLICTLNQKGIILDANAHMLEHLGYSKSDVIGRSCFDFLVGKYKKVALDGFQEMINTGMGPQIEIAITKKDGDVIFGLCKGVVIPDEKADHASYLITIQDITLMRQALERTILAEEQAERRYDDLKKTHETLSSIEKKYRNLYEHSPDLLRTIDLYGIITDCNESYAKNLGYTKEEVIGKSVTDHTAERSYVAIADSVSEWKSTGKISNHEIWLKRKDGSEFPTLISGTNLYDEGGKVVGRTVSLRDVSDIYNARIKIEEDQEKIKEQYEELKKANSLLQLTERKFRSLYDTSPEMLRTINSDGIITDCNNFYATKLGYSKNELIGMSIFDHTAEKSLVQIKEIFDSWKKGTDIINREVWMKKKDGTAFPCLLSATTFYQENRAIGSNTVIKDITELYQARQRIEENEVHIREQYEELRKIEKSKEEFVAMMTHELKTPLVPILGYVDVLLTGTFGNLTEQQKSRLSIVRSNAKYLTDLISDLLDVQKIELGQLKLNLEHNNLSELVSQAVESMKPDIEQRDITISTQIQPDLYCTCDKLRITQVINNLVRNALDFCPKENGKMFVKAYTDGANFKIIIKDNGIGVQKNKLEKIFVKFYQVDTSTTREHGGSGLGLAVCKGIIETHRGRIWAESEGKDMGTEIHISLPVDN